MTIIPITRMGPIEGLEQGTAGNTAAAGNTSFSDVLRDAVRSLQETQAASQADGYNLAMGNLDNLGALMLNSSKAEAALTLAVQMTNRVVNAYKEIMQMQV